MSLCWLCDQPVEDPPETIGPYRAGRSSLAHRACLRVLGEFELDLRAESAGRSPIRDGLRPA